jgi:hypothetical protein
MNLKNKPLREQPEWIDHHYGCSEATKADILSNTD